MRMARIKRGNFQFANTLQQQGTRKLLALREASLTRLRPVLMTSVAIVFGHELQVVREEPSSRSSLPSAGTTLVHASSSGAAQARVCAFAP